MSVAANPRCAKCGAENRDRSTYCGGCGRKFVARPESITVEGESGAYYCAKHKREITRVTCGRCEKPICTKCLVIGPAGPRCKTCASHKHGMRVRGVLHDASRGLAGVDTKKVWYLYIWFVIIRFFTGFFNR